MARIMSATQNQDDALVNTMSGDITYDELAKVEGISVNALKIKKEGSTSFFKRATSPTLNDVETSKISYKDVKLLKKFISPRGKIIPTRSSNVRSRKKQRALRVAILRARFLGLLPYVKY